MKGPTTRAIQLLERLSLATTNNANHNHNDDNNTAPSFYPHTFVLPQDAHELRQHVLTIPNQNYVFIIKPSKGSQGKGIQLALRDQVTSAAIEMCREAEGPCIVQHYISRPHTLNGLKYDLRLYIVVTSVSPLECFLYNDGLARFCTEQYNVPTSENITQDFMHLSNYSLNCDSPAYDFEKTKQKLTNVINQLCEEEKEESKSKSDSSSSESSSKSNSESENHTTSRLFPTKDIFWQKMIELCRRTMYALHPHLMVEHDTVFRDAVPTDSSSSTKGCRCFQIVGLDAMLDQEGNLHLLEVNCNPSLNVIKAGSQVEKSLVDVDIKVGLLCGTLRLVNGLRLGQSAEEMTKECDGKWSMPKGKTMSELRKDSEENDPDMEDNDGGNGDDNNGGDDVSNKNQDVSELENKEKERQNEKKKREILRNSIENEKARKAKIWSTCPLPFFPIVLCEDATKKENENKESKTNDCSVLLPRTKRRERGEKELELGAQCFLLHRSHVRHGDSGTMLMARKIIEKAIRNSNLSKEQINRCQSMLRKQPTMVTLNTFFDVIIDLSEMLELTFINVLNYLPKY